TCALPRSLGTTTGELEVVRIGATAVGVSLDRHDADVRAGADDLRDLRQQRLAPLLDLRAVRLEEDGLEGSDLAVLHAHLVRAPVLVVDAVEGLGVQIGRASCREALE